MNVKWLEQKTGAASKNTAPAQTDLVETKLAESKFSNIVLAFAHQPSVTYGGKGFGSSALKLSGKIFAMLTSRGKFVVKLSHERVGELVRLSVGEYFDPGHGRLMKEWFVVPASSTRWLELAKEAHAAASGRPGRLSRPPLGRVSDARRAKARAVKLAVAKLAAAKLAGAKPSPAKKRRARAS